MKIGYNKIILLLIIMSMMGCKALAQKFTTHPVKEGETLESISKHYKVDPINILKYNKEIKQGDALKPNTILVIPLNMPVSGNKLENQTVIEQEPTKVDEEEPIGFTTHKVKRKETLYGISKRYAITEDDIKRYNKDLYSIQLKKGMRLKIPKYNKARTEEGLLDEEGFETYTVQPKETRWSIAHKYGITIDSMLVLNPELSKTTDYLAIGHELKLPKIAGSSIKGQEVQLFTSYTVPAKQTFYSLEKQFGINAQEVMKLNPEVKERGGLKEGMVLRLPVKKENSEAVNTDNFNFYEVKPKQTEYSLTRNLGISYKELIALNPELRRGLKAGMILKLPKDETADLEVKNSLILDKINLLDSIDPINKPKLIFMLPFRLDIVNVKDKSNAQKIIEKRNDVKYSLGLYSGALVALDSIKKLGVSVAVETFDTRRDMAEAKRILLKENLMGVNAIFGPLDPKILQEVAVQAGRYNVPVIAPIPADSDISLNNVFFSVPSDEELRKHMLSYVEGLRTNENIIIIADDEDKPVQNLILEKFPEAKTVELKDNLSMDVDKFTELLSEENENWVFLETSNFNIIHHVSSVLNSANTKETRIRMFTTNRNRAYDNNVISSPHLSNLNFTYPSVYREASDDGFVKLYRKKFGIDPDRYATRGFDLTYDLLLKLAYKNNLFQVSSLIGETSYSGNKFDYLKDPSSGYFNTASYIIKYEDMRIKEVEKPKP